MKNISIIGSTGSIGTQALSVVDEFPEELNVVSISCFNEIDAMEEQIRRYQPELVGVMDPDAAFDLRKRIQAEFPDIEVLSGMEGLIAVATCDSAEMLLTAVSGMVGLRPTLAAIEAGILRECSVGVAVERVICSVCGKDQRREWCEHIPGREYDGARCVFLLDGAAEVYEVSLVAVPAQPEAGVIKSKRYGGPEGPIENPQPGKDPGADSQNWQDEALLELEKNRFV